MSFTGTLLWYPETEEVVWEIVKEFQNDQLDSDLDIELDTDALEHAINVFFNNIFRYSKKKLLDNFEIIASVFSDIDSLPTTEHIVLQSIVKGIFDETMELKYKCKDFGAWPIGESAWKFIMKYTISMIVYALDEICELDTPAGINIDLPAKTRLRRFFRGDLADQIRHKIRQVYSQIE